MSIFIDAPSPMIEQVRCMPHVDMVHIPLRRLIPPVRARREKLEPTVCATIVPAGKSTALP
jgi:hypothetical protein